MASEEVENLSMPRTDSNQATGTGSNSTTDVTLLSRKRKLTSVVWNSFEKFIVDGQSYAICKHCNSRLKAESKNGTKHLHVHLDRCIKRKNVDIKQQLLEVERRGCGTVDPTRSTDRRDSLLNGRKKCEKKMWVDFRVLENPSPRRNGFTLESPLTFIFIFKWGKPSKNKKPQ